MVVLFFLIFLLIATNRMAALQRWNWTALGALTYPLYLLHQMIGFMIFNIAYPAVDPHVLLWGTVAFMVSVSWLIHKQIEKPMARSIKRSLSISFKLVRAD